VKKRKKNVKPNVVKLVYWGGRDSRCGGGVGGVRSWPDPGGEGALEHRTSGPDILQQGAGKRSGRSGPDWMGGHIKICSMLNILCTVN
jgi:hypothetical protein